MKNILLFALLFFTQISFGQTLIESRSASLIPGGYALEGTVFLELYDDGSLDLRFGDDYLTQPNVFDVHVFLTNNNDYTSPIDTAGLLLVENIGTLTGLDYSSGPMTFNLPAGVGIDDYQHIVFICVRFGQLNWGNGEFEEVLTSTSSVNAKEHLVEIYPNPTNDGLVEIQFQNFQQNILIEVLNVNGQVISSDHILWDQQHFVKLEDAGIYFLRLTSEGKSTVRKIIRI